MNEPAIAIVADSTCDLSPELISRYGIHILPLNIILGDKSYQDGVEITPDEIYAWADAHGTTPKTSAPGMEQAIALTEELTAAGLTLRDAVKQAAKQTGARKNQLYQIMLAREKGE